MKALQKTVFIFVIFILISFGFGCETSSFGKQTSNESPWLSGVVYVENHYVFLDSTKNSSNLYESYSVGKGAIVSDPSGYWVITAAHVVDSIPKGLEEKYIVKSAEVFIVLEEERIGSIKKILFHPFSDLAFLELPSEAQTLTHFVLPEKSGVAQIGDKVIYIGGGAYKKEARYGLVSGYNIKTKARVIQVESILGAAPGDSGSPVFLKKNGEWKPIGVINEVAYSLFHPPIIIIIPLQ